MTEVFKEVEQTSQIPITGFYGKTKVRLVKAMVFPVVMYGCESWTVKKAKELMLLNCGVGEDS